MNGRPRCDRGLHAALAAGGYGQVDSRHDLVTLQDTLDEHSDERDARVSRLTTTAKSRRYWRRRSGSDHQLVLEWFSTLSPHDAEELFRLLLRLEAGVRATLPNDGGRHGLGCPAVEALRLKRRQRPHPTAGTDRQQRVAGRIGDGETDGAPSGRGRVGVHVRAVGVVAELVAGHVPNRRPASMIDPDQVAGLACRPPPESLRLRADQPAAKATHAMSLDLFTTCSFVRACRSRTGSRS
jgi:hypothetical protein